MEFEVRGQSRETRSEGRRWDVTRTGFGSFESLSGAFSVWDMDQGLVAEIMDMAETLFDNCVEWKLCGNFEQYRRCSLKIEPQ